MDPKSLEVDDLSSKIKNLGWEELHTLIGPTRVEDKIDSPAVVGKILSNIERGYLDFKGCMEFSS